jgi:hypothetical protein
MAVPFTQVIVFLITPAPMVNPSDGAEGAAALGAVGETVFVGAGVIGVFRTIGVRGGRMMTWPSSPPL